MITYGEVSEFWSKEARFFKGKRPVKRMSVKRAQRLEARQEEAEAVAPLLDKKYNTKCTSAFLDERVRWAEGYGVFNSSSPTSKIRVADGVLSLYV